MNKCDTVWDLLSAYADGETSEHESAAVEAHVAVCADCKRDLEFMQGTHAVLQSVPEIEPPISLRSSILAATVNRPSLSERFATAVRRTLAPTPVRYGALAAAGAAAALTVVALRDETSPVHYQPNRPVSVATMNTPPTRAEVEAPSLSLDLLDAYEPAPSTPSAPRTRAAHARREAPRSEFAVSRRTVRRSNTVVASRPSLGTPSRTASTSETASGSTAAASPVEPSATITPAPETGSRVVAEAPSPSTGATAAPTADVLAKPARIMLAASTVTLDPSQVATLADLRRTLGHKAAGNEAASSLPTRPRDKQIRVDVIRGSF